MSSSSTKSELPPAVSAFPEARRDEVVSALTQVLRELRAMVPTMFAAVFVDLEGECVDYASSLDAFDAKVCAAKMVSVMAHAARRLGPAGAGNIQEVVIHGDERQVVARRVTDEYLLVMVSMPGERSRVTLEAEDWAVKELRRESLLTAPTWERHPSIVHVQTKENAVWGYSPVTILERGQAFVVSDVLGKWDEDGQVCFRVRLEDARELTLAHDATESLWTILSAAR